MGDDKTLIEEITEAVAESAKAVVADVKAIAAEVAEVADVVADSGNSDQENEQGRENAVDRSNPKQGKGETQKIAPR